VPVPDPLHAEPFHADGAPGGPGAGVLLVHGFTSTPASMTPWAEHLAADGFRVSVPLLPGHGSIWQNMNQTGWRDWYAEVLRAFVELRGHGEPVFVAGLSMGGGLALRLAEERPDDVAGLMLVNPSLLDPDKRLIATPLLKRLTGSVAGIKSDIKKPGVGEEGYDRVPLQALDSLRELWRMTRADLRKITAPVLVFRSAVDHVVPALSSQVVIQEVGAADVSEQVLAESYHVAVLDNDAPQIFAESAAFARRVLGAGVGAGDAL
jgi:carboxylesterase